MSQPTRKRAFTLIELLVCIAIIGVLVALIIPAVQAAREAARKAQCKNHLKQIGIALHAYHESCRTLPFGMGGMWDNSQSFQNSAYYCKMFSSLSQLLPYLDQGPLSKSIDFNQFYPSPSCMGQANATQARLVNGDHASRSIPTFVCPSDPNSIPPAGSWSPSGAVGSGCNYHANVGVNPRGWYNPRAADGVFYNFSSTDFADIIDGASNTAAFSERLRGISYIDATVHTSSTIDPTLFDNNDKVAIAAFADACEFVDNQPDTNPTTSTSPVGSTWLYADTNHVLYSHLMQPNRSYCVNGSSAIATYSGVAMTANSHHTGGVHLLLMDGSVRFVSETISQSVWWSLGTRNGREVISDF